MRYLAIDYGKKRTGLAICDRDEIVCSPLTIIEGQANLLSSIADIARSHGAEAIVIGLPINMDDTEGPQAKLIRNFSEQLKKFVDIEIYLHDERLSSFAAEEKLAPAEFTRKKKKKRLDAVAAAQILESFLEHKKMNP